VAQARQRLGNAWTFNDNGGSHFLANSTDINSGTGNAWGLQQTTGARAAEALRTLPATLAVNQTVQVDMDNKGVTSGGSVGVCLQNASGTSAF